MKYDYDVLVIGLGPAGMAATAMASHMGLKVCAIEKHKVGGECMNVGCIPSKALLQIAKLNRLRSDGPVTSTTFAEALRPFERIARHLAYIGERKTMGPLQKADHHIGQGAAEFVSPHQVAVGNTVISAKRIFICTGTTPAIPNVAGLRAVEPLTNETLFTLEHVPESLMILGGGAIACEMAQAFARLGTKVDMVIRGEQLLSKEEPVVAQTLEAALEADGVVIHRHAEMQRFAKTDGGVRLTLATGETLEAQQVLCALGRRFDPAPLKLENAGVRYGKRGIEVDAYLRTSQPHIFACGDVNGRVQLSHAAMHQSMIAIMNCLLPGPFKKKFTDFPVPWTIFTDPQVSRVGPTPEMLAASHVAHDVVEVRYEDYGAAVAEERATGFVRVAVTKWGRVLSATIVGDGSGEMINEWTTIIQQRIPLLKLALQQHSFPTMGFLSKRIAETWLMDRMKSPFLQRLVRWLF